MEERPRTAAEPVSDGEEEEEEEEEGELDTEAMLQVLKGAQDDEDEEEDEAYLEAPLPPQFTGEYDDDDDDDDGDGGSKPSHYELLAERKRAAARCVCGARGALTCAATADAPARLCS
jgi:hypothetical protein